MGESCPEARRLGISLREVPLPPWPQRPLESPPSEWLGWFNGKETDRHDTMGHGDQVTATYGDEGGFKGDWPHGRSSGLPLMGPYRGPHRHCTYPTRGKYVAGPRWPIVMTFLGWLGLADWFHNGVVPRPSGPGPHACAGRVCLVGRACARSMRRTTCAVAGSAQAGPARFCPSHPPTG